jgi:hypothetical protein
MINGYSKTVNKQRVDFYLERIQKICNEMIDNLSESEENLSVLEIIRRSIDNIEESQQQSCLNRKRELENILAGLKTPYTPEGF